MSEEFGEKPYFAFVVGAEVHKLQNIIHLQTEMHLDAITGESVTMFEVVVQDDRGVATPTNYRFVSYRIGGMSKGAYFTDPIEARLHYHKRIDTIRNLAEIRKGE